MIKQTKTVGRPDKKTDEGTLSIAPPTNSRRTYLSERNQKSKKSADPARSQLMKSRSSSSHSGRISKNHRAITTKLQKDESMFSRVSTTASYGVAPELNRTENRFAQPGAQRVPGIDAPLRSSEEEYDDSDSDDPEKHFVANEKRPSVAYVAEAHKVEDPPMAEMVDIEQQELDQRRKQQIRYWLGFVTALLIIGGVIAVVLAFVLKEEPTPAPSQSPTFTDIDAIEYARTLSDSADYDNPSSPQSKALGWLKTNNVPWVSEAIIRQRYTLAVLFYSSNGEWDADKNWLNPNVSVCEWFSSAGTSGICNDEDLLTILDLNRNGISGTLPTELGHLADQLQRLDLTFNNLFGEIPTELGLLSNLEILHVSENDMTEAVPTELGSLSSLIQLYVDNNSFSGSMPAEICALKETGNLAKLWADCYSSEEDAGVKCDCCKCCTTFPCVTPA